MYSLKVELTERKMSELVPTEDNDFMEVFKEPLDQECVEFSVGNPRVEHITGIVHLYKRNSAPYGTHEPWKALQGPPEADVSQTLCCLAIPADMSVAHFCTFIGAYLGEVRSIQVLRREGSQPSVCMVLLSFATQEQADGFFGDFNGLPFSSLEPDILCRLVYVRNVEVMSSRGRPTPVSLPAAAKALTAASPAPAPPPAADAVASPAATSSAVQPAAAAAATTSAATLAGQPASTSSSTAADSSVEDASGASSSTGQAAAAAGTSAAGSSSEQQQQAKQTPDVKQAQQSAKVVQQQQQQQQKSSAGPSYAAALGGQSSLSAADSAGAASKAAFSAAAAANASGSAAAEQWLEPPPGTTELPTCPVCLERLDEHISGVVTTVCNHRFHGECIKHWGDTSCPVCRYCMLSSNASTSRCSTCGTNSNLWICLICGHVGCGRYKQGHANDHWKASAHCYSLELETQRVWDYAGDGYVHRLIQSKTDGKLVEVPSPAPTCPHGSPSIHHHRRHQQHHRQRSTGDGRLDPLCRSRSGSSAAAAGACSSGNEADGDTCSSGNCPCPVCADEHREMKEVMVSSKLEAISLEYNHLLATQLDSQRQYFEGLLVQQDSKQQAAVAAVKAAAEQAQAASEAAAAAAKESERKRQQLDHKLSELNSSLSKVTEEREFLRSLNETLLSNQKEFNSKLTAAQAELTAKDAQLQDLQEQVHDLMMFIEAQRTIQSAGGSELQDATLLPMPQSRTSSGRSSRRTSSKK